jgi:2-hydroxychromene-2-carboxylate isomerase
MWAAPKKLDDPAVLKAALIESSLPADASSSSPRRRPVKEALIAETQRAVERGTFGSPTFFVDGEIYFGKDRLRDVEEAIAAAK